MVVIVYVSVSYDQQQQKRIRGIIYLDILWPGHLLVHGPQLTPQPQAVEGQATQAKHGRSSQGTLTYTRTVKSQILGVFQVLSLHHIWF
jgi:hypothetical protein